MSDIKLEKYKAIKGKISSSSSYFESSVDKLKKAGENLAEGVILNGRAYDKGMLSDYSVQLSNILDDLKSVSNFCSNKISSYVADEKINTAKSSGNTSNSSISTATVDKNVSTNTYSNSVKTSNTTTNKSSTSSKNTSTSTNKSSTNSTSTKKSTTSVTTSKSSGGSSVKKSVSSGAVGRKNITQVKF